MKSIAVSDFLNVWKPVPKTVLKFVGAEIPLRIVVVNLVLTEVIWINAPKIIFVNMKIVLINIIKSDVLMVIFGMKIL